MRGEKKAENGYGESRQYLGGRKTERKEEKP